MNQTSGDYDYISQLVSQLQAICLDESDGSESSIVSSTDDLGFPGGFNNYDNQGSTEHSQDLGSPSAPSSSGVGCSNTPPCTNIWSRLHLLQDADAKGPCADECRLSYPTQEYICTSLLVLRHYMSEQACTHHVHSLRPITDLSLHEDMCCAGPAVTTSTSHPLMHHQGVPIAFP